MPTWNTSSYYQDLKTTALVGFHVHVQGLPVPRALWVPKSQE